MRAGRLLSLLLILQNGGRVTARELASRLQVSERTVLRDLEVLGGAGVPVYAVRGRGGGFELLDTFELTVPPVTPGLTRTRGPACRVRVRISPAALQEAVMLGRPEGWRPRPNAPPHLERPDWVEGSFRFDSYEAATRELLGLGIDVEVVLPISLRESMVEIGRRISELHCS